MPPRTYIERITSGRVTFIKTTQNHLTRSTLLLNHHSDFRSFHPISIHCPIPSPPSPLWSSTQNYHQKTRPRCPYRHLRTRLHQKTPQTPHPTHQRHHNNPSNTPHRRAKPIQPRLYRNGKPLVWGRSPCNQMSGQASSIGINVSAFLGRSTFLDLCSIISPRSMCEGQSRRDDKFRSLRHHLRYSFIPDWAHLSLVCDNSSLS